MTTTTTETTGRRVYVRRLGYAELQEVHGDHSATVRLEDDHSVERVPFGDWVYDRSDPAADTSPVELGARIRGALRVDFGEEFAFDGSGVGESDTYWLTARYAGHVIRIEVAPEA